MYQSTPPQPIKASQRPRDLHPPAKRSLTDSLGRRNPPRDRPRAWSGTPSAILQILVQGERAHVPTMMMACQCPRNTIHQAISRLRSDGFNIETIPPAGGPWLCNFYRLLPNQEARAQLYLIRTYLPDARKLSHDN